VEFTGEIGAIYLLSSHQRRGLGRRMMTEVAHLLLRRNLRSMLIWVLRDIRPAGSTSAWAAGPYARRRSRSAGRS